MVRRRRVGWISPLIVFGFGELIRLSTSLRCCRKSEELGRRRRRRIMSQTFGRNQTKIRMEMIPTVATKMTTVII